jgi:ribonuclease HII
MLYYERKLKRQGKKFVIGVDEVGRGPLAGPVVAAAVLLKTTRFINRIDDSKKLTPRQRENAFLELAAKSVFGIGMMNEKIVDRLNILEATRLAMEIAVEELLEKLTLSDHKRIHVLVDGNVRLKIKLPLTNIIRGDSKSKSIASASILAKVIRDRIMAVYDKVFPQYGFARHKGYPTQAHRIALKKFGRSLIHRTTFAGV